MEDLRAQIERYRQELLKFSQRGQMSVQNENNSMPDKKTPMPNGNTQASTESSSAVDESMTVEEQYLRYVQEHPKQGYIQVQTFTAQRSFPVEGATVRVSKSFPQGSYLLGEFVTDAAGMTEKITVPAAEKSLSEKPGAYQPYSAFDITVEHPEYARVHIRQVPVFEGVVSRQSVDMVPRAAEPDGAEDFTVTEPSDL